MTDTTEHSVLRPQPSALVLDRLRSRYGPLPWHPHGDPLTELVLTILSQHTNDTNSGRAFTAMQRAFPSWDEVLAAEPSALADSIRQGGLANQKAPRIQQVLARIKEERDGWEIDFLAGLPLDEAKQWLRSLPGVGPKTAACVLMFALGRPALPVDTHVYRVARRLGLIEDKTTPEQAHALLEAQIPPGETYAFHIALIKHGRHTCTARTPRCGDCPLNDICPSAFRVGRLASLPPQ
ncbi:MAG: endonuclease III domain-containing protein [Dehalococcoidia bacterium]